MPHACNGDSLEVIKLDLQAVPSVPKFTEDIILKLFKSIINKSANAVVEIAKIV